MRESKTFSWPHILIQIAYVIGVHQDHHLDLNHETDAALFYRLRWTPLMHTSYKFWDYIEITQLSLRLMMARARLYLRRLSGQYGFPRCVCVRCHYQSGFIN